MSSDNKGKILKENEDGTVIRLPEKQEEFQIFERMGNDDIISKMNGNLLDAYVYQFKSPNGDTVVDLTKDGLFAFANLRGGIKLKREWDNLDDKESDEYIMIYSAEDIHTGDVREGSAQEQKVKGSKKDAYAVAKCMSKAQRNALKNVLNVDSWRKLILIFLEGKDKQKREMILLSISDNIEKFKYDEEAINSYCMEKHGVDVWDSLDTDSLASLNSFMVGRRGRDRLKPSNDDSYLPDDAVVIETKAVDVSNDIDSAIEKRGVDRKKLERFVKGRKQGRGLDELDETETANLIKFIQLSNEKVIQKLQ